MGILVAMMLFLAGCAFKTDGYKGSLGCVNLTGPGFTIQCPEELKAPALPDSQKPPATP